MTIDPSELLLATVGISTFINGEAPKITIGVLKEARDLPQKITERAAELCKGQLKHTPIPRPHSYKQLLDRLTQKLPPHELEAVELNFAPDEHDLSNAFTVFVQNAYQQLREMFPTSGVKTFAGPKPITPTDDRVFKFWNDFALLNSPLRVFDLIGSGSLLRSQAAALRKMFPTMSAFIDEAIQDAVVDAKAEAEEDKYALPPRAEYGVAVWFGRRAVDFKPAAPPAPGAPKNYHQAAQQKAAESLKTNAQRAAESPPSV